MFVLACIKQVPDTTEVKMDPETGTLIREGVPSVINPSDVNAVEECLKLKGFDVLMRVREFYSS